MLRVIPGQRGGPHSLDAPPDLRGERDSEGSYPLTQGLPDEYGVVLCAQHTQASGLDNMCLGRQRRHFLCGVHVSSTH
jgi:hypothetical protein